MKKSFLVVFLLFMNVAFASEDFGVVPETICPGQKITSTKIYEHWAYGGYIIVCTGNYDEAVIRSFPDTAASLFSIPFKTYDLNELNFYPNWYREKDPYSFFQPIYFRGKRVGTKSRSGYSMPEISLTVLYDLNGKVVVIQLNKPPGRDE